MLHFNSNFTFILAALVEYKNISKKTLQESIESEMSGDLEKLLVAVGKNKMFLSLLLTHRSNYKIFIVFYLCAHPTPI